MDTRKKAKLISAIEQIADEQEVAIHDVISHLIGVVFDEEDAGDLLKFYNQRIGQEDNEKEEPDRECYYCGQESCDCDML